MLNFSSILFTLVISRGGGKDTAFEVKAKSKDSEKVRGQIQGPSCREQVASRPRTKRRAKNSGSGLKIRENKNENIEIMFSRDLKSENCLKMG